jgi:lipopolysaccharide transport system ATP-binding protein
MADTSAIVAEGLSKRYTLGRSAHDGLREVLSAFLSRLRGRPSRAETFWALDDVSFSVDQGEALGIIGANGAGKTTLLKILSRITEPTRGRATIRGRVASLLEVGTGFHPELTGRENIFLNGALMGMDRQRVRSHFDEIVDFSGVSRFLDTPVKRYSSGMYVRLAFAVAAHLDSEILLVDEILAVGDTAFQRKCLGKMEAVTGEGRTVLFVTHQLGMIGRLCDRALLLREGRLVRSGPAAEVIDVYLESLRLPTDAIETDPGRAGVAATIVRISAVSLEGIGCEVFAHTNPIGLEVEYRVNEPLEALRITVAVADSGSHQRVFTAVHDCVEARSGARYRARAWIPASTLTPRTYSITVGLMRGHEIVDVREHGARFTVVDGGSDLASSEGGYDYGLVFVGCVWSVDRQDSGALTADHGRVSALPASWEQEP